jgi:threonine aldolase
MTEINLYSDTQTKPTPAMYAAMVSAEVGDEQHGRDPTVNALCERVAALLGKEAAMFFPTGTMCNQIAFMVHCKPGDEIIAHDTSHVLVSEGGGPAVFSGSLIRPVFGESGQFTADELSAAIRSPSRYKPRTRAVVIEQTANFAGGTVWPLEKIKAVGALAHQHGLIVHMDGARLLNAVVQSGVSAASFCQPCDTAWIDLTKGLGCPVGAVMAGSKAFIEEARVWKQRIGGAMRQAGVLAGAGLYALDHHIERLAQDHENARLFVTLLAKHPRVRFETAEPETNIVIFGVTLSKHTAHDVAKLTLDQGVRVGALSDTHIRVVTHLDVSTENITTAVKVISYILDELA